MQIYARTFGTTGSGGGGGSRGGEGDRSLIGAERASTFRARSWINESPVALGRAGCRGARRCTKAGGAGVTNAGGP